VHEVLGAVDGIDGEGVLGLVVAVEERRVVRVRLLAEHHRVRVGLGERLGEEQLGLVVGHGHQVAGVLLGDLMVLEAPEPRIDHLLGDVLHEAEHGVGVHAATLAVVAAEAAVRAPR
jgi:hypothetical protein